MSSEISPALRLKREEIADAVETAMGNHYDPIIRGIWTGDESLLTGKGPEGTDIESLYWTTRTAVVTGISVAFAPQTTTELFTQARAHAETYTPPLDPVRRNLADKTRTELLALTETVYGEEPAFGRRLRVAKRLTRLDVIDAAQEKLEGTGIVERVAFIDGMVNVAANAAKPKITK